MQAAAYGGQSRWQIFLTAASMVGVINAALAGSLAGLTARQAFGAGMGIEALAGVAVAGITMALHVIWQLRAWARVEPEAGDGAKGVGR